jgi:hypothetical protein
VPPPPPSRSCAQTRKGIHKLKQSNQIKQPIRVDELQDLRKERQNTLGKKNEEKEAFKNRPKINSPQTQRHGEKQTNKQTTMTKLEKQTANLNKNGNKPKFEAILFWFVCKLSCVEFL